MKNTDKTKKEFEKVLFKLLEKENYHNITINKICALANKTKMTFYHYYKDKDNLLAEASINLVNKEYKDDYEKIVKKETSIEEIEYQSIVATFEWVAKHYNQIQNLTYKGETLPLEIFKTALFDNYKSFVTFDINENGYDIPSDYISYFLFNGIYGAGIYYAEQLKNSNDKNKVKEDVKKICRLLAKFDLLMTDGSIHTELKPLK